jgi:hypothetical protein
MHFLMGKARCNATYGIGGESEKWQKKKGAHTRTPNPNRETKIHKDHNVAPKTNIRKTQRLQEI